MSEGWKAHELDGELEVAPEVEVVATASKQQSIATMVNGQRLVIGASPFSYGETFRRRR